MHFGCVQNRFREAFDLFRQLLFQPLFTEQNLQKTVALMRKDMAHRFDYPTNIAVELFHKTLWPKQHPYSRLAAGTSESLKSRTLDEIIHHHQTVFMRRKPSIALVGNFDPAAMHTFLEESLSPLQQYSAPLFSLPQISEQTKAELTFHPFDGEQSHLVLGFEGLQIHDQDRDALLILMACLNGQSGLLFQELRDKHSLCYQVQGFHFEGLLPGACGFYLGCAHEKVPQAFLELDNLIQKITHTELTQTRVENAKNLLVGQQQLVNKGSKIERWGIV